ncbi:Deoxyguanosinetriphosphate triphosphohydrolase-like protein [Nymphon striatum]|nr:Deoxyguanosinetriphosphate triphosphohydrolase-like protein [Nymphon striatum]
MSIDKKVQDGVLHLVLMKSLGESFISSDFDKDALLKHCSLKNAAKLGDVGERFLKKEQPSLEAQLTNIADQIAYNNHDIDDGIRSGLINIEQMREMQLFSTQYDKVMWKYPELKGNRRVHETIRRMIGEQVVDLVETSRAKIADVNPQTIDDVRKHSEQLISFSDDMRIHNQELKKFLRENLYYHHKVYRMTRKAHQVIKALFDIFMQDLRLLPPAHLNLARNALVEEGLTGTSPYANLENKDSDGDGLTDLYEEKIGTEAYLSDTDGDGIDDGIEVGKNLNKPLNSDNDKRIDAVDYDDDNDGLPTFLETQNDTDKDGIKDYLDVDSDNDGLADGKEAGALNLR